jgi:hypothetical protein
MPKGEGHRFTERQERMHAHIKRSLEEEGFSAEEADRRAWATVVKRSEEAHDEERAVEHA